ncbi:uncharacterized protein LOC135812542 [Sycon ciliatum]|uniref:uncharacterized protein LOC135812542 n=1 Tax=Sycon ciliatum TaxID=27933 RepID=UPI0031F6615E
MIARVLHGTSALLITINLCLSGSLGAILQNCQPEDGKIHVYGNTVYVQPATDPESLRLRVDDGILYKKLFIFKSPCDISFEAISLRYYGTCSVSVSYGSDNRVLEIIQFPDPLTTHWHSRNVSLTKSASQSLHSFMKRSNTSKLLITISPGISHCQLYPVDHNRVKGLVIFGHDINECANGAYACRGMANPGNRKCVNTVGSYYCRCLDGFTGSTCIDIDECQNGKHNCNEMVNSDNRQCQNLNGSYHCPCLPGYAGSQCDGGFVSIVTFAISISLVVVVSGLTISILIAQLKRKYTKAAHMRVQTAALQNTVGTAGSNALSLTGNDAYGTTTSGVRQDPSLYDTIQ